MELQSKGSVTIEVEYYDALKKAFVEKCKMEEEIRKEYDNKMLNAFSKLEKSLKSVLDFCDRDRRLRESGALDAVQIALIELSLLKDEEVSYEDY